MTEQNKLTARKIKALETKDNLFKSALKLFTEKGFDIVSVDEIAAEAGTSKGTFYTYFENKEQVLIEQYKQVDDYYQKMYRSIKKNLSAGVKLMTFVKKQNQFACKKMGINITKTLYSNQIRNGDTDYTFITDENRAVYRIIKEIIEEGQASGEFRSNIPSKDLARMVTRCMRGTIYEWCLYNGKYNLIKDAEWFFSIFIDDVLKSDKNEPTAKTTP